MLPIGRSYRYGIVQFSVYLFQHLCEDPEYEGTRAAILILQVLQQNTQHVPIVQMYSGISYKTWSLLQHIQHFAIGNQGYKQELQQYVIYDLKGQGRKHRKILLKWNIIIKQPELKTMYCTVYKKVTRHQYLELTGTSIIYLAAVVVPELVLQSWCGATPGYLDELGHAGSPLTTLLHSNMDRVTIRG